jgi:CubicO group peptidase (beta-lactamase class C family)
MQSRNRARFPLAATLAACATLGAAQAQGAKVPRVAEVPELSGFAERWSAAMKALDVPGFSLAVVMDEAVLAVDAFGVRNVAGEPATPDTCYYIASVTKPYTAMAVCILAGEGKLDLDAPVKKVLPQLQLLDEELTDTLSLRDLLCHRPGIDGGRINHREVYTGQITDEIYFELLRQARIAHEVRYNNVHLSLAARVVEAVSGKKWQDFLAERLFAPTGLTRTTAYASELYGKGEHAEPMLLVDGKWIRSPLVKTDRTMSAAGGMGTTARDAARWLILNANGGELDGRRVLPRDIAREYYTQQSAHPRPSGRIRIEEGFALGWNTGKYRDPSRPYFFHGGGYVGAAAYFCFLPNERIGVAVLSNTGEGGSDLATIVSIDVLDRLLGVEGQPDLLPTLAEEARKRREDPRYALPGSANPAKAPRGLSRPPEEYAGTYTHPLEGELDVRLEGGELKARIGDYPYMLVSTGQDEFTACVFPGMNVTGAFELDSGGAVVAVRLKSDSFERVGAKSRRSTQASSKFDVAAYAGTYRSAELPGYTFVARAENGKLLGHMTAPPPSPAQPELELQPAGGEHKFQVTTEGARFVFKVAGGSATGFTIHQSGDSYEFQRVER